MAKFRVYSQRTGLDFGPAAKRGANPLSFVGECNSPAEALQLLKEHRLSGGKPLALTLVDAEGNKTHLPAPR